MHTCASYFLRECSAQILDRTTKRGRRRCAVEKSLRGVAHKVESFYEHSYVSKILHHFPSCPSEWHDKNFASKYKLKVRTKSLQGDLSTWPQALMDLGFDITVARLPHNRLVSIPDDIPYALPDLEELDLSDNAIEVLPPDMGGFFHLERLYLDGNCLSRLSRRVLSKLPLVELGLSRNKVRTRAPLSSPSSPILHSLPVSPVLLLLVHWSPSVVSCELCPLAHHGTPVLVWSSVVFMSMSTRVERAAHLDSSPNNTRLHFLQIQTLPDLRMSHLRVLDLSYNNLQDIPSEVLTFAPRLEELYLNDNGIATIPYEISELLYLR